MSGPTAAPDTGMPVTVNESTLNDPPPNPPPPPVSPLGGPCWVVLSLLESLLPSVLLSSVDCCWTWPENVLFSRVSTPVAALTPSVLVIVDRFAAFRVLVPRATASRDCDRSVEPLSSSLSPWLPKSKLGRPPFVDAVAVLVTVMSVPTP
ncbi:hypothetical protein ACL00T_12110 [Curtobacterium flaccumfaciens]